MGAVAAVGAQVLAGAAGVDGQEGGQDLRHGRRQGAGAGAAAAAAGLAGLGPCAQREQLARTCAQQGRQDVPPLQERRAAHQVKCVAQAECDSVPSAECPVSNVAGRRAACSRSASVSCPRSWAGPLASLDCDR